MIYIFGYVILCLIAGLLGSNRELGFWGFLILSFVITPFGALLLWVITKEKKVKA